MSFIHTRCAENWSATSGAESDRSQKIAARHIDLIGKLDGRRLTGLDAVDGVRVNVDFLDRGRTQRAADDDAVAAVEHARRHVPRIAAAAGLRPDHRLHMEARRLFVLVRRDRHGLKMLKHRRALVPGHALAAAHDIVAVARDDRDRLDMFECELRREHLILVADRVERRLPAIDQVHLVDDQQDAPDAEQRENAAVAQGLPGQAGLGVDQQQRKFGVRGAGHHVAGILLMARRVGDDEGALRCAEIAIGHVDGDALLALGLKTVEQQGIVEIFAGGAEFLRQMDEIRHLVVRHRAGLHHQAADQGRLAVVHRAAGEEAQMIAFGDGGAHQK